MATDWCDFGQALARQKDFSSKFFETEGMSQEEKTRQFKSFLLSLHAELSELASAVNYKDHRPGTHVDPQKILFESVDVYRYLLAILNLWGVDADVFSSALEQKDELLHYRHELHQKKWDGRPVVLFDMDDVLAGFRDKFCDFASRKYGFFVDPHSPEYYNTTVFKAHGVSDSDAFRDFIDARGFSTLDVIRPYRDLMQSLKEVGYWVHIVTARPEHSRFCYHDTYSWLYRNEIPADAITFTPEKYAWLVGQPYLSSRGLFAIDDSPKHAAEYAKHGVRVLVPSKTYNKEISGLKNVTYVDDRDDPWAKTKELLGL